MAVVFQSMLLQQKESLKVLSWEVSLQTAGMLKAAVKSAMFYKYVLF